MDVLESSLFGGLIGSVDGGSILWRLDDLEVKSVGLGLGLVNKSVLLDKGKGRVCLLEFSFLMWFKGNFLDIVLVMFLLRLLRFMLWVLDDYDCRYKFNWKYVYIMCWCFEFNWDLGKYINF